LVLLPKLGDFLVPTVVGAPQLPVAFLQVLQRLELTAFRLSLLGTIIHRPIRLSRIRGLGLWLSLVRGLARLLSSLLIRLSLHLRGLIVCRLFQGAEDGINKHRS